VIVLDTTVLVYAVGAEHPLRDPCARLVEAIGAGAIQATTTVEVIEEFVHVGARRRGRSDSARLGSDYAELLSPLLSVTPEHLLTGLALFERHERLDSFDAVLVAATAARGATALVSADAAFRDLPEIAHVTPDDVGVTALLST
jgi:predicted nucleic acid-binding protein